MRGRDPVWELVKYKGDMQIYARCKCGFKHGCTFGKAVPTVDDIKLFPYCPICGAKKKRVTDEPRRIDKYSWED